MVTTSQAAAVGVSRGALFDLVQAGAFERVRHGVYRATMTPPSPHDDLRAVWLQAEPAPLRPDQRRAAVCRQTAAWLYGIGDLFPPAVQVTLSVSRRTNQPDVRFYVGDLAPDETDWIDAVRVTRPARIIADLLADGYADLEHLGSIAVDAVMGGSLTPQALIRTCSPYARQFGLPTGDGEALARQMWDGVTTGGTMAA
jgi:hypothetical protein